MQTTEERSARIRADRRLIARWQRERDHAARDELVRRMLPLARSVAARYRRGSEPLDDLVQVAVLGLVKAIDRFDPTRETAFSSYAVPTMVGELKRHFRDHGWAVHVPRGLQERILAVEHATGALSRRLGRSPSAAEVADACGLCEEEVLEALEAAGAQEAVPLEGLRFGDPGSRTTYADTIGEDDAGYAVAEAYTTIGRALATLPERDRMVVHLRFAEDLTQAEIAARVGISQMHVSRLLRRSLDRLRLVAGEAA